MRKLDNDFVWEGLSKFYMQCGHTRVYTLLYNITI